MKSKVDKWDDDKSVHISVGLRKLSDVVINDVVKKTEYILQAMRVIKIFQFLPQCLVP